MVERSWQEGGEGVTRPLSLFAWAHSGPAGTRGSKRVSLSPTKSCRAPGVRPGPEPGCLSTHGNPLPTNPVTLDPTGLVLRGRVCFSGELKLRSFFGICHPRWRCPRALGFTVGTVSALPWAQPFSAAPAARTLGRGLEGASGQTLWCALGSWSPRDGAGPHPPTGSVLLPTWPPPCAFRTPQVSFPDSWSREPPREAAGGSPAKGTF